MKCGLVLSIIVILGLLALGGVGRGDCQRPEPPAEEDPTPAPMPQAADWLLASRNVVAVVTNRGGVDVYAQIENYADPEHVAGVILLAGRPVAHVAGGEYVLIVNVWGLLAEVRYGENWQAQGWVSVRELCTHPWCWPVR